MTNYLAKYSTKKIGRFQAGGAMEGGAMAPEAQMAPEQGGMDIQGMLMQAYEAQDPNMALQVVNAIVESMQGQQAEGAPEGGMPVASNGMRMSTPVFRKGGKLKAKA
jgi:hypothetical protein